MENYPELLKHPQAAEDFFNTYKKFLPEKQFLTGFNFAIHCDNFHWAFNRYLVSEKKSMYRINSLVREFFNENKDQNRRLVLYILFIKGFLQITEDMLLQSEYYELMNKFENAQHNIQNLIGMLAAESVDNIPTF